MKNSGLFALAVITSILFASCDTNENYGLSANLGGTEWVSNGGINAFKNDSIMLINGFNDDHTFLALELSEFETPGTYVLDSANNAFGYGTYDGGSTFHYSYITYGSHPGTYTITTYSAEDKHIVGTFSLMSFRTATDSMFVQEGRFNVYYH